MNRRHHSRKHAKHGAAAEPAASRSADRRSRPRRGGPRPDAAPRVGQLLTLEISDLSLEGEAVAKHGQYVLFVPGAIPGEQVVAEVQSVGPRYGRARVVRVNHPAPSRIAPRCRHFGVCGGCAWQHIAYAEQLRFKERLLRGALEHRLPGVHLNIRPMHGMQDAWGSRHKVHFLVGEDAAGELAIGHFRAHSREFVPVVECPVHAPVGNRVAQSALAIARRLGIHAFSEERRRGVLRHLVVRVNQRGDATQATLVATRPRFPGSTELAAELAGEQAIQGLSVNVNARPGTVVFGPDTVTLHGDARLSDEIAGVKFRISPTAFFQTNPAAAARLVETVIGYVPPLSSQPLLDLYAGVGLFAAPLARRGHRVVAVEESPQAVADAIDTLKDNRISGCRYLAGKVETTLKKLARTDEFSCVILDPPREGCPDWILRLVARRIRPQRIIDVSCDPNALARDLAVLTRAGYRVREIQPIDMFPHTAHIESVACIDHVADRRQSF